MKFHSSSTWNELDVWVNQLGVPADGCDPRRDLLAGRLDGGGQGLRHRRGGQICDIIAVKGTC
jgi:hypothetical protein